MSTHEEKGIFKRIRNTITLLEIYDSPGAGIGKRIIIDRLGFCASIRDRTENKMFATLEAKNKSFASFRHLLRLPDGGPAL